MLRQPFTKKGKNEWAELLGTPNLLVILDCTQKENVITRMEGYDGRNTKM